jgi:hypothetical protein
LRRMIDGGGGWGAYPSAVDLAFANRCGMAW